MIHASPYFGEKPLDDITEDDIEGYIKYLKEKGLANTSINHNLAIIKIIFNYAEKRNEILYNPLKQIGKLKSDTKEKGTFTNEEAMKLFYSENMVSTIWSNDINNWLLNFTAYRTGMRLGELQALREKDIHEDYISVEHSLDRKYGIKGTKTEKSRSIPINNELKELLYNHIKNNSGDYVFGKDGGNRPIRHDEVYKAFWQATFKIGISKAALKSRKISFHSWRHSFTTRLVAQGIAKPMIKAMTGHSSGEMLEHYTHIGIEELNKIAI
jgi:site-specific recombinase XerD